jgi:F0F1-type ATP synthase membrane subunit b/b'
MTDKNPDLLAQIAEALEADRPALDRHFVLARAARTLLPAASEEIKEWRAECARIRDAMGALDTALREMRAERDRVASEAREEIATLREQVRIAREAAVQWVRDMASDDEAGEIGEAIDLALAAPIGDHDE